MPPAFNEIVVRPADPLAVSFNTKGWSTVVRTWGDLSGPDNRWNFESSADLQPTEGPDGALWIVHDKGRHSGFAGDYPTTDVSVTRGRRDCSDGRRSLDWHLESVGTPQEAGPGKGTHILIGAFQEDGLLVGTNIPSLETSNWTKASTFQSWGTETLPVYVYDKDPQEEPSYWKDPLAGTPAGNVRAGLGYTTMPPGVNDVLKTAWTGTSYAFRVAAGDAYTQPGNEGHPLYGRDLVFLVKVLDVVDAPCPQGAPAAACGPTQLT